MAVQEFSSGTWKIAARLVDIERARNTTCHEAPHNRSNERYEAELLAYSAAWYDLGLVDSVNIPGERTVMHKVEEVVANYDDLALQVFHLKKWLTKCQREFLLREELVKV